MRNDALGLFWRDEPVIKVLKVKPERHAPERTWEYPDYLPNLDEALAFNVTLYTNIELTYAVNYEALIYDIECYENYFVIAFMGEISKKIVYFEFDFDGLFAWGLDAEKLRWVFENFKLISFNGINYDLPIAALALAGKSTKQLKEATDQIILYQVRPYDLLKSHKVKKLQCNHIDIIEVCPLQASLKIYAGRIHAPRMQDLPFKPSTYLTEQQIAIVRWYCINDLNNTLQLYQTILPEIALRESMGSKHLDLRSKSDAQIAEFVISRDVEIISGVRAKAPEIEVGTIYHYNAPAYLEFKTPLMRNVLDVIKSTVFYVDESGAIGMPQELKDLLITIGTSVYRMGIGGLHSTEKSVSYKADEWHSLIDRDVVSYYPRIILNLKLYPKQLGTNFLTVYEKIVVRRLAAKARQDDREANSLKIVVNGSFGKLSSKYSILYAPDLFLQVTVTGQLSLLLLIEALELAGVKVVSGNTDGVVIYCLKTQEPLVQSIIVQWEGTTKFETEETRYKAIYSKDVNNYIAIYEKPKKETLAKTKGAYATTGLSKNPTNWICVEAVIAFLTQGIPIAKTVNECKDITKFVTVRTVKGGAIKPDKFELINDWVEVMKNEWVHKWQIDNGSDFLRGTRTSTTKPPSFQSPIDGTYLGKSIRWYYAKGVDGYIINALNGHQVPKSEGAKPLMDLPEQLPNDINYEWYISECESILEDIAY